MSKIIHAVIGPAFGDEGKGKQVSYLAREILRVTGKVPIVVRFQGGCQAGHTVVSNGARHVFGHIGSGALDGCSTLLTRDYLFNPLILEKELKDLRAKITTPRLWEACNLTVIVDPRARVTTPVDMILNQMIERLRGGDRHGSCGLGINETICRHEGYKPLHVQDVCKLTKDETVHLFEDLVTNWFPQRLTALGFPPEAIEAVMATTLMTTVRGLAVLFFETIRDFKNVFYEIDTSVLRRYEAIIFEGAQGLLLDEEHEFFPHVTHSHTGLTNLIPLLKEIKEPHVAVTYPLRWYMTRHGNGPFPTECPGIPSPLILDSTNLPNDWQGELRYGTIDVGLVRGAIRQDLFVAAKSGIEIEGITMVLNCLDQLPAGKKIPLRWDGGKFQWSPLVYLRWWAGWLGGRPEGFGIANIKVVPTFLMGYGPDAADLYPTPTGYPGVYLHETEEVPV